MDGGSKAKIGIVVAAILMVAPAPGAIAQEPPGSEPITTIPPRAPYHIEVVTGDGTGTVNDLVSIDYRVTAFEDASLAQFSVRGTANVSLGDDPGDFSFPIEQNKTYEFQLSYRFNGTSEGLAVVELNLQGPDYGPLNAYVYFAANGTQITYTSNVPPDYFERMNLPPATAPQEPGQSQTGGQADAGDVGPLSHCGNLIISGRFRFTDGATTRDLANAYFEVWDSDAGSIGGADDPLASGTTASDGSFLVSVDPSDCVGCGTVDVYVRGFATNGKIRVVPPSGDASQNNGAYKHQSPTHDNLDPSSCSFAFPLSETTSSATEFRLLQYGSEARDWTVSNFQATPPLAVIRWPLPSGETGLSHYHVQQSGGSYNKEIHIATGSESRSTTYHEYGHRVMNYGFGDLNGDWPSVTGSSACPSSGHFPGLETSTYCAWTEGWAEYFEAAVSGSTTPEAFQSTWASHSDRDEGNIRNALYDLEDGTVDSFSDVTKSSCERADTTHRNIYLAMTDEANNFNGFVTDWESRFPSDKWMAYGSAYINGIRYDTSSPSFSFLTPDDGEVYLNGAFVTDTGGGPAKFISTASYTFNFIGGSATDNKGLCKARLLENGVGVTTVTSLGPTYNLPLFVSALFAVGQTRTYTIQLYDFSGNSVGADQLVQFL